MRTSLIVILSLFAVSCSRETPAQAERKPAAAEPKRNPGEVVLDAAAQKTAGIATVTVQPGVVSETVSATGTLTVNEDRTWAVGSHIEGRVSELFVKPGDIIKQGEVLANLHSHEVHDSRADYRRATDELTRARLALLQAQRVRDRFGRLLELKAASKQDYELAQGQVREAENAVRNAETEIGRVRTHITDYLGIPIEARAGEHGADVPIVSPESGVLLDRKVSTGSVVGVGQDMFRITDPASLWMMANVAEVDLQFLRIGQPVQVVVRAHPGRAFNGRILRLGEELDPTTRTLQVRVLVPNQGRLLKPEMYATAEIERAGSRPALFVPESAAQELNGAKVVFVRTAPDRFQARAIDVTRTTEGRMEIASGIEPGDEVVVKGSFVLKSQMLRGSLEEEE